jgi:hypothetical protein
MPTPSRAPAVELAAPGPAAGRWAFAGAVLLLAAWGVVLGLNPRRAGDLHLYALAARRFWAGLPLYPASDGLISFKYAPAAAWLFTPFALLPAGLAGAAWNLLSVAAFAFAAATWAAALREEGRFSPTYLACLAAALALAQSFFLELFYGQVNLFMLALLAVPLSGAGRRRDWASGACLAVATILKPTTALLAVALVATRRTRVLAAAIACGVVLHLPLLARYGWPGTLAELRAWSANLDTTTLAWVVGHNPQGFPSLMLAALYPLDAQPARAAIALAEALGALALLAGAFLARLRGPALWSMLCLGVTMVSPLAWRANFVLAWPLLLALLSIFPPARRRLGAAAVACVAGVEWIVSEAVLGQASARAVLATRVWGLAFVVALAAALWLFPRGSPDDPADQRTLART